MSDFAEISREKVVLRVVCVPEDQEGRGEAFLRDDLGLGGRWVQTFRENYAGPGMIYDEDLDIFHAPTPEPGTEAGDPFQ